MPALRGLAGVVRKRQAASLVPERARERRPSFQSPIKGVAKRRMVRVGGDLRRAESLHGGTQVGCAVQTAALGDSLTVEQRTLTPLVLVRIQVPQPNSSISKTALAGFPYRIRVPNCVRVARERIIMGFEAVFFDPLIISAIAD